MKKRLEIADIYPTAKARTKADAVVEAMPDSAPMSEYMRRWELAYIDAGGVVRPPKRRR